MIKLSWVVQQISRVASNSCFPNMIIKILFLKICFCISFKKCLFVIWDQIKKNYVKKLCCDFNHWAKNTNGCAIKNTKLTFIWIQVILWYCNKTSGPVWVILIHGNFLMTCGIERLDN